MVAGKPRRTDGRTYLSFSFPLLSAIFGSLIPPDTYRYIPLAAFEDLVFEIKLNPFAFYTSGFATFNATSNSLPDPCAISPTTYNATAASNQNTQLARTWQISKIELNCDILSFQQSIETQIENQFASSADGIIIQTCGWCSGPTYTFSNNSQVQGTYALNMGFNSLKGLFFVFNPLDYQKYTFCRKLFRINANLTKFQVQLGQDLLPVEGVKGHAGYVNASASSKYQCNKNFLINLFKAFNKLHDMRGNCIITPLNFAINDRPYDPTFRAPSFTHIKQSALDSILTSGVGESGITSTNVSQLFTGATPDAAANVKGQWVFPLNTHTSAGQTLFHENRVVGRAIFGLDTETMSTDFSVLSGLNTTESRPFNLILETDTTVPGFTRDIRMVVFFYYDMVIQLKKGSLPIISGRQ